MTDTHGISGIMKAGGGTYGRSHPRGVAATRIAAGLFLLALGIVFAAHGSNWTLLLFPAAALHFWLAARLLINVRTRH